MARGLYATVEVIVTGSMQPMAHGEDPEERLYVTRSLPEVEADPDAFKDKCLRVDLKPVRFSIWRSTACSSLFAGRRKS
jgi:hypothetical protein